MRQFLAAIVLCLSFPMVLFAQTMHVKAPATVYEGDRFTISFSVDDRATDFRGPSFKGFTTLSGPSQSTSSSISFVNGHRSQSYNVTFNYLLQADQVGVFTVSSASCISQGKKLTTDPFTIKVEKADPQRKQQQQAQQQRASDPWGDPWGMDPWGRGQQQQQQQQPVGLDAKSLFARASISKNSLYQGEQAIITYKIYTQVPITEFQIDKLPGNKGFWAEDLSEGKEIKQYEETLDGRRYQVAEIRRGALFAQDNGQIKISPLDLDVLAMVQQQRRRTGTIWDLFDDPFFNRAQAVEKHLTTNSISVNVKPLPPAPEGFCGAVGQFDVKYDVDVREVKANEAINYKITISGSGNLMLIDQPQVNFSSAFEVYDPQVSDQLVRSDNGVSGSRTYQWVIIPRTQGEYEIPEVSFSYFNPKTASYVTKKLEAVPIKVNPGDAGSMVSSSKGAVQIKSDINFIKTGSAGTPSAAQPAVWFWVGLAIILIAGVLAVVFGKKYQASLADVAGRKQKRATCEARKRLKRAASFLDGGNDDKFYEEIYKAIWGCLADHFNIPLASLSSETVQSTLAEHNVPEDAQNSILATLADVDYARFAPGDSSSKKQQIYDKAILLISSI